MDIKTCSIEELHTLAADIRQKILDTVSKNGGHLSSTMGATDLIVAMHRVFDVENDPFIFDVSHQAYAHKLLTGRWDDFDTLRQFDGLCGYT
ncbi:MAG TPA: 1-deoxy-D-xylulose-5-phosphate synthase, partial [Sulfurovum sp.]|nr:1-deoxy-D-xylulose-5-phosphate synthase [Sulfurovum sp.]